MGSEKISWNRLVALSVTLIVSVIVGITFQPNLANSPDSAIIVTTIFSILAGFLIAVISLTTDPVLKQAKDWQELHFMKATVRHQLLRHVILFELYLITLGLAFAMSLVPPEKVEILYYLQLAFLVLATFVFLISFALPWSLMKIQMDRYNAELDKVLPKAIRDAQRDRHSKQPKSDS